MAAMRTTAQGDQIGVDLVHDFIRCALTHDAIADHVSSCSTSTSSPGATTPSVIAAPLKAFIPEVLNAATEEDWQAVADELIDDARTVRGC